MSYEYSIVSENSCQNTVFSCFKMDILAYVKKKTLSEMKECFFSLSSSD